MIKTSAIVLHYTIGVGAVLERQPQPPRQGREGLGQTPGSRPGRTRRATSAAGTGRSTTSPGAVQLHDGILSRQRLVHPRRHDEPAARRRRRVHARGPAHTGAYQDGYLFAYGSRYGVALGDFRNLTGPAPLLPERAFGMWFSRYQGYCENDYHRLLARFRAKKIPLDVLVVDTDWKAPHNWNGWQWTPVYFPDPTAVRRLGALEGARR